MSLNITDNISRAWLRSKYKYMVYGKCQYDPRDPIYDPEDSEGINRIPIYYTYLLYNLFPPRTLSVVFEEHIISGVSAGPYVSHKKANIWIVFTLWITVYTIKSLSFINFRDIFCISQIS